MASRFVRGNGRDFQTGLRVLRKSASRDSSTCFSRNSRGGGVRVMSRSSTSRPISARNLLALRQVVHVGFR